MHDSVRLFLIEVYLLLIGLTSAFAGDKHLTAEQQAQLENSEKIHAKAIEALGRGQYADASTLRRRGTDYPRIGSGTR